MIEKVKQLWGSNQSRAFKFGSWGVALGSFYLLTVVEKKYFRKEEHSKNKIGNNININDRESHNQFILDQERKIKK